MKLKRSYGFFDCFRATSVQEQVQKDKNIIIFQGIAMPHLQSYETLPASSSDVDPNEDAGSVSSMTDASYLDESISPTPLNMDDSADNQAPVFISFDSERLRQLRMPKPIPKKLSESERCEDNTSPSIGGC